MWLQGDAYSQWSALNEETLLLLGGDDAAEHLLLEGLEDNRVVCHSEDRLATGKHACRVEFPFQALQVDVEYLDDEAITVATRILHLWGQHDVRGTT